MTKKQEFSGLKTLAPVRRIFPLFDPAWEGRVFSRGRVGCNKVEIIIEDSLLEDLLNLVSGTRNSEVGGVLVGGYYTYNSIDFVSIDAFIPARFTQSQRLAVKFTHETWSSIRKTMDGEYSGKVIVGWYHTHPFSGLYFSQRDVFVHESFFNLDWQIALVIDPNTRAYRFFQWKEGRVVECGHYYTTKRLVID